MLEGRSSIAKISSVDRFIQTKDTKEQIRSNSEVKGHLTRDIGHAYINDWHREHCVAMHSKMIHINVGDK